MEPILHYTEEKEIEIDGEKVMVYITHYLPSEPPVENLIIKAYRDGVNSI